MNNVFIMMEKALSNVNLKNQFFCLFRVNRIPFIPFRRHEYFPGARLQGTGIKLSSA